MRRIEYTYSFAPPHRITLSRPSAPRKVLADASENGLDLAWSFDSLEKSVYNVWQTPKIEWKLALTVRIDGEQAKFSGWKRDSDGVPAIIMESKRGASVKLYGIAAETGVVIRAEMSSCDGKKHEIIIVTEHKNGWVISNPAWVDGKNPNILTCMQNEKADRLLAVAYGADEYPVIRGAAVAAEGASVPMTDMGAAAASRPEKSIFARYFVPENGVRTGYVLLPHAKYAYSDLESLLALDPELELRQAAAEWRTYLRSNCKAEIPENTMSDAFYASLADIFVMRERLDADTFAVSCGTEVYRSTNDGEPTIADRILDRLGYACEVAEDLPVHLGGAGEDGDWNTPQGWCAKIWSAASSKCALAWSHYKLTGDRGFLEKIYPTMYKNSEWQRCMRLSTMDDPNPSKRGLMPRGMGDCGLKDSGDYFGIYYPPNFGALEADKLTLAAARELGMDDDAARLEQWLGDAEKALCDSVRRESTEGHIESGPTAKDNTSRYGSLKALSSGALGFDDPLIRGTIEWMEHDISDGGLPRDLGWLRGGLWVAIALDNLSAAYLRAGMGDEAVKYLYPTVEHASPLITWCEERGAEPGSSEKTGDLQHLWTPVAVVEYVLDAMCLDTGAGLRLGSGTPRDWLEPGGKFGVDGLRVPGGKISYRLERVSESAVSFWFESETFAPLGEIELVVRTLEAEKRLKFTPNGGRTEFIVEL